MGQLSYANARYRRPDGLSLRFSSRCGFRYCVTRDGVRLIEGNAPDFVSAKAKAEEDLRFLLRLRSSDERIRASHYPISHFRSHGYADLGKDVTQCVTQFPQCLAASKPEIAENAAVNKWVSNDQRMHITEIVRNPDSFESLVNREALPAQS